MSDGERERVAVHETSHVIMAYLVRLKIEAVSIEPTEHYGGVAIWAMSSTPRSYSMRDVEQLPPSWSSVFAPAPFRRHMEQRILTTLAGPVADSLLSDPARVSDYIEPDADQEQAE